MAYVVTRRCAGSCYTDCVAVCPADCFYAIDDPAMLVIDPDTCLDCGACGPVCPIQAIYIEDEVPVAYADDVALNAERWATGAHLSEPRSPLPTAVTLEQLHAREAAAGLDVPDP